MTEIGVHTILTDETVAPAVLGPALEERGFAALFLGEHSHVPVRRETPNPRGGDLPRMYFRALDPFVALAVAAATTTRLRLGTGVTLLVQRDPLHAAKEIASLDVVSGGRVIVGVGVGWLREEIRDHGTDPRVRGAVLDERLAAVREVWTRDRAEFHGRYVDFDPVYAWPKPVQRPHPPVYVGGGAAALARARRFGAGWMPSGLDPSEIRARLAGGADVPVIVNSVPPEPAAVAAHRAAGTAMITFHLPAMPAADALRTLDGYAAVARAA